MKKITALLALFLATACVPHFADYQPQLSSQPNDMQKYESDRQYCIKDAAYRMQHADPLFSRDGYMNGREMVDECLAKKGYSIAKNWHCC